MVENLEFVMTDLALRGGAKIMEIYESGDWEAAEKDDKSPVTAADLAADKVISAGLKDAFPDIPAVTEEATASHQQIDYRRDAHSGGGRQHRKTPGRRIR